MCFIYAASKNPSASYLFLFPGRPARSLGRNANLRSAMDLAQCSDRVRDLARCATRLWVRPKHLVVEGGSAAEELFVVCQGEAELLADLQRRRGSGVDEVVEANSLSGKLMTCLGRALKSKAYIIHIYCIYIKGYIVYSIVYSV